MDPVDNILNKIEDNVLGIWITLNTPTCVFDISEELRTMVEIAKSKIKGYVRPQMLFEYENGKWSITVKVYFSEPPIGILTLSKNRMRDLILNLLNNNIRIYDGGDNTINGS